MNYSLLLCGLLFLSCQNDKPTAPVPPASTSKTSFATYKKIPLFIRQYLDSVHGGKFLIAESHEPWNSGCVQEEGKPNKQMISAIIIKDRFVLKYWRGGIGARQDSFILALRENKIAHYLVGKN